MFQECDNTKLQKDSPYMLFYQQDDLEEGMFLPNFNGQTPDSASDDEEYENEVRRLCFVQWRSFEPGTGEESYNLYTFFVLKSSFNEYLRERKLSEML